MPNHDFKFQSFTFKYDIPRAEELRTKLEQFFAQSSIQRTVKKMSPSQHEATEAIRVLLLDLVGYSRHCKAARNSWKPRKKGVVNARFSGQ